MNVPTWIRVLVLRLSSRWRQWVASRARACVIEQRGVGFVAYCPAHPVFIREYYRYCVDLFAAQLARHRLAVNLVIGDYTVSFANTLPTLTVDIQYEHTLVAPGGRDSAGAYAGTVPLLRGSGCYLVRIERLQYLRTRDIVIEYSRPNIENVSNAELNIDYVDKNIYIAPTIYSALNIERNRHIGAVSLFADLGQARRRIFLDKSKTAGLDLRNLHGIYDATQLQSLYLDTRVLVNVHQTEHHHTFEELRVLPALLCGVVVVSEIVPLRETIPYADFIVWSEYDALVETAREVLEKYETYRDRFFGDGRFEALVNKMRLRNEDNARLAIERAVVSTDAARDARDSLA